MAESLRIILIGKTGCGKSSTGNFILGKQIFESKRSFKSTTKEVTLEETDTFQEGRTIKVVDTPGLFDTDQHLCDTALKIQNSLKKVSPGPHAFLIVLNANRYTEEEKKTQQIIQLTFGETIFKHSLIIFTCEDFFESSEDLLREAGSVKEIQTLIELCGGRCITLNSVNRDSNYRTEKLKNIAKEINAISKNGNVCYNEDLTKYTEALKEQANNKTDNTKLSVELLNSILSKLKDDAKEQNRIGYEDGHSKGFAVGAFAGAIFGGGLVAYNRPDIVLKALTCVSQLASNATCYDRDRRSEARECTYRDMEHRDRSNRSLFERSSHFKFDSTQWLVSRHQPNKF